MTVTQEDALYDFLENATEPFTIDDVISFIRMVDSQGTRRLSMEISALVNARNLAFHIDKKHLISRRGCFEPVRFVIKPSRLEIMNGILIPGHRCVPFANPILLPHEYIFTWKGEPIPLTTTEAPPEEFYPYYGLFGEEYAPQYIARDNPENESAFNADPYEDPPEVSLHTLDMRNIYRETSFVPDDVFSVQTIDWKGGTFELERVPKDTWNQTELYDWFEAAEAGFRDAFKYKGPGSSTEEQISYAYWYGGKRMRELPAYALDDFIYNKTEQIETVPYGIETRFWYAGKEIPDQVHYYADQAPPDRTLVEEVLFRHGIPVSEYAVQSYIRDALFRREEDPGKILRRIVPPVITLNRDEERYLSRYIEDVYAEFSEQDSRFAEKAMGDTRLRVGELHTAVADLMARLKRADIDSSWYPKHTFVILSQIQGHAASVLEDLDVDEAPSESELEAIENSLDSMIETYEDMKDLIDESMDSFRRCNLSVVKPGAAAGPGLGGMVVQATLGGTDVWRRFVVSDQYSLREVHRIIQILYGWTGKYQYSFSTEGKSQDTAGQSGSPLDPELKISDLKSQSIMELWYEYGSKWLVKILLLFNQEMKDDTAVACISGAGASPPESLGGPLRFRRFVSALKHETGPENKLARHELGADFDPNAFDLEEYNGRLARAFSETR
ncbi:plasmid pRiA4b ORF-3 family protein [Breznakiella homolactica]|uniref:Plasmid pRiA4b Orf3-like domain-containing protein n=1 Tax=Breznakiella homolactica TaxID=2798577 RepID=A0A7T8B9I6_9SPIR|nr:plasmid pRiA4b ORF-3 family protein [Breznakiella homolactica]QQO09664.1 plasmid pRiA4b ORF-3 family protein [Breznakiella homolactica]